MNRTLRRLETLKTKANTGFNAWWAALNAELTNAGEPEAGFDEASGCYEMGESPETAVAALQASR